MNFHLSLSQRVKDFIASLEDSPQALDNIFLIPLREDEVVEFGPPFIKKHLDIIDVNQLLSFLKKELNTLKSTEEKELFSLLLIELYRFLNSKSKGVHFDERTFWSRLKYLLLRLSGLLYSACEGFGGIISIFSISPLPFLPVFIIGLAFSLVSMFIFYSLDLVDWSKSNGLELGPNLLSLYKEEKEAANEFISALNFSLAIYSISELEDLELYASLLEVMSDRQEILRAEREEFLEALNHPLLILTNYLILSLAAILAFSAGFFSGQTVAIALASLLLPTVAVSFWPEVLFSGLVGLASLIVYFFLRKPELETLASNWVGLDKEKILNLPDKEEANENIETFKKLKQGISCHRNSFFAKTPKEDLDPDWSSEMSWVHT